VIFPHVYGDRLILVFYALLVPYVAVAVARGYRLLGRVGTPCVGVLLWVLAWGGLAWRAWGGVRHLDVEMLAVSITLTAVCLGGLPELTTRRTWLYVACAVALGISLGTSPTPEAVAACRLAWLLLAMAVFSGSLIAGPRAVSFAAIAVISPCVVSALAIIWSAGIGGMGHAAERALTTAVPVLADTAAVASVVGLAALAWLCVPSRSKRYAGVFACLAGATLGLAALSSLGGGGPLAWSWLFSAAADLGTVGAACYLAVTVWVSLPLSGPSNERVWIRLLQGVVVAILVGAQFGKGIASINGGAVLIAAGLLFGVVETHRSRMSLQGR